MWAMAADASESMARQRVRAPHSNVHTTGTNQMVRHDPGNERLNQRRGARTRERGVSEAVVAHHRVLVLHARVRTVLLAVRRERWQDGRRLHALHARARV
jgi:hypothetical protein